MKNSLTVLALLLASVLYGCSVLPDAASPGSSAAKLQSVLRGHPDKVLNKLTVSEYRGTLQVHGFVNTFRQKNAVEALINDYGVIGDLDFAGRIVSRVGLYADYDCRASSECFTDKKCFTDTQCDASEVCGITGECW